MLRYGLNSGSEYYFEFKDSVNLTQYFRSYNRAPRMYSGKWHITNDTLYIKDQRGAFNLVFREMSDSVMILTRTDSVELIFDALPSDFEW